jgi:hypothetical protein
MSTRASRSRSPRACSGATYPGVPTIAPVKVSRSRSPASRAIPKSTILTRSMLP